MMVLSLIPGPLRGLFLLVVWCGLLAAHHKTFANAEGARSADHSQSMDQMVDKRDNTDKYLHDCRLLVILYLRANGMRKR